MSSVSALKAKLKRLENERRKEDDGAAQAARMSTPDLLEYLLTACEEAGLDGLSAAALEEVRPVLASTAKDCTFADHRERAMTTPCLVRQTAHVKNDEQIVVRLPKELADRLRAYAGQLAVEFGVPVSVGAATRRLIAAGLDETLAVRPFAKAKQTRQRAEQSHARRGRANRGA